MSDSSGSPQQPQQPMSHPSFQVRVPLEWSDDEDVPIVYANQVLVSHGGPEFFIVFGVVLPPANPGELPDTLKIQPQVRVVVSRDAMASVAKALNDNLVRYNEALKRGSAAKAADDSAPK